MKHTENIPTTCQQKSRNVIFPEQKNPAGGRTTDKGFLYVIFPGKKAPAGGRTTDKGFFIYIYIYIFL